MEQSFTDTLAEALQRVADAHEAHQKENGPDPDWPTWYTERLTAGLGDDRAELAPIFHKALRHAGAAHGVHEEFVLGGVHDVEWPAWYAEHMTSTLGEENARRLLPGIKAYLAG